MSASPTEPTEPAGPVLRDPDVVLSSSDLGGARATRHSFVRTMLRRAVRDGWTIDRQVFDIDADGRGTATYAVTTGPHRWTFVAFSTRLDEAQRTDRVVASAWDVTAALVEGDVDAERLARLREQVPLQEAGRAEAGTVIWTRANRSERFFDYVVDRLASGRQPERDAFGPSPYVLRSTAFYSNGKLGLADFEQYADDHPFAVPYRAHMLCAWILRELGYHLIEHCAALRSESAVRLEGGWRRYLGLGNATGLGMVPYVVNHPEILDAWTRLRELPLATVLDRPLTAADQARVRELLDRAVACLSEQGDAAPTPYLSGASLATQVAAVRDRLDDVACLLQPWRALHDHAAEQGPECRGVVASVLTELSDDLDESVEGLLRCVERRDVDPRMRCDELLERVQRHYRWIEDFDFTDERQRDRFWYSSLDNEEPRRARSEVDPGAEVQHAVDIARAVDSLRADVREVPGRTSVGELLLGRPWLRGAVARVQHVGPLTYGELRANLVAGDFVPLHVQRLQLAVYGMDNFSPQSTDWLRVTLLSGAPRVGDLAIGTADDDWSFTLRPAEESSHQERSGHV